MLVVPVTVSPFVPVKLVTSTCPVRAVPVNCTEIPLGLMATPVGELAVNESVADGWNWCVPSGLSAEMTGGVCAWLEGASKHQLVIARTANRSRGEVIGQTIMKPIPLLLQSRFWGGLEVAGFAQNRPT